MFNGKFETIPLTVVQKETEEVIKETVILLRIRNILDSNLIHIIAACEEGVFDTQLSKLQIKRAKSKADLNEDKWLSITKALLSDNIFNDPQLPEGYENVILVGKLVSLEQYDTETGDLLGDELADEVPKFELGVCSKGVLSVTYGTFVLPFRATDEVKSAERKDYDILQWVQLQTMQIKTLQKRLFEANMQSEEQKEIAKIKEDEIRDMTKDYELIILDIEDRFFQVLNRKRRKIRELQGEDTSDLDLLNITYKKRNATNLNHVNIEDIALSNAHKEINKVKPKREKRRVVKKNRAKKNSVKKQDVKEESSNREETMDEEERNELSSDDDGRDVSENEDFGEASKDIEARTFDLEETVDGEVSTQNRDILTHAKPEVKLEEESYQVQSKSPSQKDGEHSDATMYSDSDQEQAGSPSQRQEDADRSTDYGSGEDVHEDFNKDDDTDYGSE